MSIVFITSLFTFAKTAKPSTHSCEYYKLAEARLQCGSDSYLQKWAYPLCEFYIEDQVTASQTLQEWYPKVRYCLQNELKKHLHEINCENIEDYATESHLFCYSQTEFCDLPTFDQIYLFKIVVKKGILTNPFWLRTSLKINSSCAELNPSEINY